MPSQNDADLRALLRRADPARSGAASRCPGSDDFAGAVWRRIGHAAHVRSSARAWRREIRPLAAAAALLAALLAGGSVAYARHQRIVVELQADDFARSVDPVLMHAAKHRR